MNSTWVEVLQVLTSPAGQALLQSTEKDVIDAIGGLFKHAHASSNVTPAKS